MGKYSELDLDDDEPFFTSAIPTNEVFDDPTSDEVLLQMQAIVSDVTSAEKELTQLLYRWKYYNEPPPREDLERILTYIEAARRTLA